MKTQQTAPWTTFDMPSLSGKTAVVTGTGGLGFEVALALAGKGANVILAGRSPEKGAASCRRILDLRPEARIRFEEIDLADLGSIRSFVDRISSSLQRLDILVNNAGVMTPPERKVTSDGFELQFGTNYLGHFALTAGLLPLLTGPNASRVVTVSSIAARQGSLNFDDLQSERSYGPMEAYSQSKLACLMFALELQRRSDAKGWGLVSVAAHPGLCKTDLLANGGLSRTSPQFLLRMLFRNLFPPASQGALPLLYAATADGAIGGGYYGPDRVSETRGYPAPAVVPVQGSSRSDSGRLWTVSESLAGLSFGAHVSSAAEGVGA